MHDKYFKSITKDIETALDEMAGLRIYNTTIKRGQRPDGFYPLAYAIKFQHLVKNIKGIVYLIFDDIDVANGVAMSIAKHIGAPQNESSIDDYLCEFINTAVGNALTTWEKLGFSASISPPEIIKNSDLVAPFYGCETSTLIMDLDVSHLVFKLVFIDGSYDVLMGKKILVVDDSNMIQRLLNRKLSSVGFVVKTAFDGRNAVEKAKTFIPDLIIMDQNMPRLSGLDAIMEIRSTAPKMKFIMLSSSSRTDELNSAQTLNVLTYLRKPVKLTELYVACGKALMSKKI